GAVGDRRHRDGSKVGGNRRCTRLGRIRPLAVHRPETAAGAGEQAHRCDGNGNVVAPPQGAPAGTVRAVVPHGKGFRARAHITTLTMRLGTTMTLRGVLPAIASITFGRARAAARTSSSPASRARTRVPRSL